MNNNKFVMQVFMQRWGQAVQKTCMFGREAGSCYKSNVLGIICTKPDSINNSFIVNKSMLTSNLVINHKTLIEAV